jgi:CheY-like chemotaxis protein
MSQLPALILLVDDDDDLRETMGQVLEERGYRVVQAAHGRAALDYLVAGKEPPALILLDLMMPEMSGWQLHDEMKRVPRLAALPIVVVTASRATTHSPVPWALEVVFKPFALEALLATVARHLPR